MRCNSRYFYNAVVVTAVCAVASDVAALAGCGALSHLQQGDQLHVSYQSHGCFHEQKYEIDFERSASVTARSAGRTITLSPKEVAGLDRLFQFYRSRPSGGCTTRDDISISQFRGPQKISSERYVDGSCATYKMKDVIRLYEIAKKLGLEHDT
jgi:hypothetical protein